MSVRLELQADFLAGVWAHHGQERHHFLQKGDIESALHAASSDQAPTSLTKPSELSVVATAAPTTRDSTFLHSDTVPTGSACSPVSTSIASSGRSLQPSLGEGAQAAATLEPRITVSALLEALAVLKRLDAHQREGAARSEGESASGRPEAHCASDQRGGI